MDVFRNEEIPFERIMDYDGIVLSPGPGLPSEAGDLMKLIETHIFNKPIFGVCLGFQAIAEHFKGVLFNQHELRHGVSRLCNLDTESKLFRDLPHQIHVGLYHSWCVDKTSLPDELIQTAYSEDEILMAFEHASLPICGVQFHPESIMTEHGKQIVENFICNFIHSSLYLR